MRIATKVKSAWVGDQARRSQLSRAWGRHPPALNEKMETEKGAPRVNGGGAAKLRCSAQEEGDRAGECMGEPLEVGPAKEPFLDPPSPYGIAVVKELIIGSY